MAQSSLDPQGSGEPLKSYVPSDSISIAVAAKQAKYNPKPYLDFDHDEIDLAVHKIRFIWSEENSFNKPQSSQDSKTGPEPTVDTIQQSKNKIQQLITVSVIGESYHTNFFLSVDELKKARALEICLGPEPVVLKHITLNIDAPTANSISELFGLHVFFLTQSNCVVRDEMGNDMSFRLCEEMITSTNNNTDFNKVKFDIPIPLPDLLQAQVGVFQAKLAIERTSHRFIGNAMGYYQFFWKCSVFFAPMTFGLTLLTSMIFSPQIANCYAQAYAKDEEKERKILNQKIQKKQNRHCGTRFFSLC